MGGAWEKLKAQRLESGSQGLLVGGASTCNRAEDSEKPHEIQSSVFTSTVCGSEPSVELAIEQFGGCRLEREEARLFPLSGSASGPATFGSWTVFGGGYRRRQGVLSPAE